MPRSQSRRRYHSALLLAALPIWMATQSSACPFLLFFNTTTSYDEFWGACEICNNTLVKEFEDPTNPEDAVVVTFEITSFEPLEPQDATVEMRLTCGNGVGGFQAFPVTLQTAGLTKLTGKFEGTARSLCVGGTGQRSPGLWSVYLRRNISGQGVSFSWKISYKEYVG